MSTDELLQHLRDEIPGCLAAFVASAGDGSVIASRSGADIDADAVAASLRELFVRTGALAGSEAKEVIALADDRIYVGQVLERRPGAILAAVCDRTSNLGLLLGIVRNELAAAEELP